MANINFNKLGLKINSDISVVHHGENLIEVKNYLPIQDKLRIVEDVIRQSMTEYNYANPIQVDVYTCLNILKYYTNIKFTDKQLSEPAKLYDLIASSNLVDVIYDTIPKSELDFLFIGIEKTIKAFYDYRTSVLGILDTLKYDYSDLNTQLSMVLDQIKDPEALSLIHSLQQLSDPAGGNF